jgi:hypothetical protein
MSGKYFSINAQLIGLSNKLSICLYIVLASAGP